MKLLLRIAVIVFLLVVGIYGSAYGLKGLNDVYNGRYSRHLAFSIFYFVTVFSGAIIAMCIVFYKMRYVIKNRKW